MLYCADAITANTCPGYPVGISLTPGTPLSSSEIGAFTTTFQYPEFLNRITGELYFFAIDNATQRPRVVCANLQTNTSCTGYLFASAPVVSYSSLTGPQVLDGGAFGVALYAMLSDGTFACFDTSLGLPCEGTSANGTFASGITDVVTGSDQAIQIGSRIYQWFGKLSGGGSIACFDMSTNVECPDAAFPLASDEAGTLFPTASSQGVADGFCVAWSPSNKCYSLTGVEQVKPNLSGFLASHDPSLNFFRLGTALLYGGKTYWLDDRVGSKDCWDWATDGACAGFDTSSSFFSGFYEAVIDPDRPGCIWTLGDSGQIKSIDAVTGEACSSRSVTSKTVALPIANCNAPGDSTAWNAVNLTTLVPDTDFSKATITVRDSLGAFVPGFNAVTVTAFPFDISSIPYAGTTKTLSITLELSGIPNPVPAAYSATPAPSLTVSWTTNESSQMCFDVNVACSATAPIENTVAGILNGSSFSSTHRFTSIDKSSCGYVVNTSVSGGNGAVSANQNVLYNTTADIFLTPDTGYASSTVAGSCGGNLNGNTFTTSPVTADCTVTANFTAAINGVCGSDNTQTLIAPPANPLCTQGVASDVTASGAAYAWSCTSNNGGTAASCGATRNYGVSSSVTDGNGAISPSQAVTFNATPTFTLTPAVGFVAASVGGTCGGVLSGNTYTTTAVTADCTVIANFTAAINGVCGSDNTQTLPTTPANPLCTQGTASSVTTSNTTYAWSCNSNNGGTAASCAATRNYGVNSSVTGGNGAISASLAVLFNATPSFTLTPAAGFVAASVAGTCGGTLSGNTYTTTAVTADCSVAASFVAAPVVASKTFTGPTATGTGNATVTLSGGGEACGFSKGVFVNIPATSLVGYAFPQGLMDISLTGCTVGTTVAFNLSFPNTIPADAKYWKYGPEVGNPTPHWYSIPATITGNTVTFSITDGGMGDDDLIANGMIVDPSGPGVPTVAAGVTPTSIPTLSEWSLMLLAGLLGLTGMAAGVRRHFIT